MKRLASFGVVLPLLLLGAASCGDNNTQVPDVKFRTVDVLADFEITSGFNPDPKSRWNGNFIADADATPMISAELGLHQGKAAIVPARKNPDGTESTAAFHVSDGGLHSGWGSATVAYLTSSKKAVDLSEYTGMSVWMKSDGMAGMTVKVGIADFHSFPDAIPPGCDVKDQSVGGPGCYDDFSVKLYPDGTWRRYDIAFSQLTTGGWGYPHAFDPTRLYEVKFSILPNVKYDIWFDDISFYIR